MQALGIDIGGTGIKGAPVDLATGKLLAERKKIATPRPSTPEAVTEVVREVAQSFGWTGPVGATFPGVVTNGTIRTAANVDKSWVGTDAASMFGKAMSTDVVVLNDADAAGIAEMTFGAGVGVKGSVLMPNTEFGHIEIRGKDAEKRASESAKVSHDWGWKDWTQRVSEYLQHIEALLSPGLIIVGGGISKEGDKWIPMLTGIQAKIVAATLQNDAGIVGAAIVNDALTTAE